MKLRDASYQPWFFLTVMMFLFAYYLVLAVVSALMCRWAIFTVSLATALLLIIILPLGVLAHLRYGDENNKRRRSEFAGGMERFSTVDSFTSRVPFRIVPPLAICPRPPENTGNDFSLEKNENSTSLSPAPGPLAPAPTSSSLPSLPSQAVTSLSASEASPSTNDSRSMSMPMLRQPWLPPPSSFGTMEEKLIRGKVKLPILPDDNQGESSDIQLETLTRSSLGTGVFSAHSNQRDNDNKDNDDKESVQHTPRETQSLERGDTSQRRPQTVSICFPPERDITHDPNPRLTIESISLMTDPSPPIVLQWIVIILFTLLILLLLAGSFWIAYDTDQITAALLIFAAPILYLHLIQLARNIDNLDDNSAIIKSRILILHPISFIVLTIVALILYIVSVILSLKKNWIIPYIWGCDSSLSMSMKAVFFLSPIPIIIACGFGPTISGFILGYNNINKTLEMVSKRTKRDVDIDEYKDKNPLQVSSNGFRSANQSQNEDDESELSSIVFSRNPSIVQSRAGSRCSRSVIVASSAQGDTRSSISTLPMINTGARVGVHPQIKSMTLLYVAYRDVKNATLDITGAAASGGGGNHNMNNKDPYHRNKGIFSESNEAAAARFQALVNAAKELEISHGPFVLTAHYDALCFVWGVHPLSADPVLWAVDAAQDFFTIFAPPSGDGDSALVAAVLHSPHALVSLVGTSEMSSVHFLTQEHHVGEQLLSRGFLLRSYEKQKIRGSKFSTSGLLLDRRAAHLAAAHILSRPVGIVPLISSTTISGSHHTSNTSNNNSRKKKSITTTTTTTTTTSSSTPTSTKTALENFTVIYDFVAKLGNEQEEWHLAARAREERSASFLPAVEAAQAFYQGNLNAAKNALESPEESKEDALLQLLLADVKNIAATSENVAK